MGFSRYIWYGILMVYWTVPINVRSVPKSFYFKKDTSGILWKLRKLKVVWCEILMVYVMWDSHGILDDTHQCIHMTIFFFWYMMFSCSVYYVFVLFQNIWSCEEVTLGGTYCWLAWLHQDYETFLSYSQVFIFHDLCTLWSWKEENSDFTYTESCTFM